MKEYLRQATTLGFMISCFAMTSCGGGGGGTDTSGTVTPPPVNVTILGNPVTIFDDDSNRTLVSVLDGLNAIHVRINSEPAIYQYRDLGFTQIEFPSEDLEGGAIEYSTIRFCDLDSDGDEDLIFTDDWLVKAMTYDGTDWTDPYLVHDLESGSSLWPESIVLIRFLDMDSDGDKDYQFGLFAEDRYEYYWCENLGPSRVCSSKIDLNVLTVVNDESGDDRIAKYFVDLNNDGIPDVVRHSHYLYVRDFSIRAFFSTAPWEYPIESTLDIDDTRYSSHLRFSDLNNDGLVDLSLISNPGEFTAGSPDLIVYFNSGANAFLAPKNLEGLPEFDSSAGDIDTRTWDAEHDFNLDGATDYIYFERDKLFLASGYSGSEGGFTKTEAYDLPASLPDDWNARVHLIDLDDDGDQDLVYQAGSGRIGYIMNLTI